MRFGELRCTRCEYGGAGTRLGDDGLHHCEQSNGCETVYDCKWRGACPDSERNCHHTDCLGYEQMEPISEHYEDDPYWSGAGPGSWEAGRVDYTDGRGEPVGIEGGA